MIKSNLLNDLNTEQIMAVTHANGPLLIIAGAGTGKTKVITHRIAWLIEQKLAKPEEILALTFTEKAAAEMEERVDRLVPYGFVDTWISTFHAFGDRLLRDYSLDLGLPANFKVLTKTEQAIFLRQNIYAFELNHFRPIANPLTHIDSLLTHFSRLRDELISPEDYLNYASSQKTNNQLQNPETIMETEKTLELAKAYERYQELMIQSGNLDFGDQIFLTYKLLKNYPSVLAECQKKFKFILVDEYQDTNYAQNEIVKLLASNHKNISVVGDDDQSIYRFRGASISNIMQFKKDYKNITKIVLNKNYRSTQEILDASYKLIQHNNPNRLEVQSKINKKLIASSHGPKPELLHCENLTSEADRVAKEIIKIRKEKKLNFKDFAILVRANNHAIPFLQSLNILGIPHVFSGASGLYNQPEIKMLIAFLKCLINQNDNMSFFQLATSELYNVPISAMTKIYAHLKQANRTFKELENEELKEILPILNDIDSYKLKLNSLNAGELLYDYLISSGYLKQKSTNTKIEDELKIINIAKFFSKIAEFNQSTNDKSLIAFLDSLELLLDAGDDISKFDIDPDIDAVNVLTVHSAKGLEWPIVFVVNCVADRFPSRRQREQLSIPEALIKEKIPEGDFHIQEERRLFYVALTRAKQQLFLTSADDYGGKRTKKLSHFILEMFDNPLLSTHKSKLTALEKIDLFKKAESRVKPFKKQAEISGTDLIKLSRQQIDDYYSCPKKYYFAHVIKIPLLENHFLMYGTAIHAALDHYFNRKLRKETPTLESLLEDFKVAFKNIGFITREHEESRYKNGLNTLIKFYDDDQKFGFIPSGVEVPFEFLENNVKINGRYDLIYSHNGISEICDFKTSDVREQKDADRRIKESTQMMIYALSWMEKHKTIPKTTLYFIESGLKGERVFSKDELINTKQMIFNVANGIKKQNFMPIPDRFTCNYCPYRDICTESIN